MGGPGLERVWNGMERGLERNGPLQHSSATTKRIFIKIAGSWKGRSNCKWCRRKPATGWEGGRVTSNPFLIRKLELSIKVQVCLGADLQLWSIYIIIYIYIYVYNITPKRLACPWILPSTSFYLLNCYCRKKYYISWPVKYMIGVVPTWFLWFVLDGG